VVVVLLACADGRVSLAGAGRRVSRIKRVTWKLGIPEDEEDETS